MKKKTIVIPLATLLLVSGLLFVTPQAHAAGPGDNPANFFSGLITFLSQKFGLDKTQVQSAVTQYHQEHKPSMPNAASMQQREQQRLDALVKQGKITADQEKAIITELASLRSKYNLGSMQNETPDQRKTNMQNMQNDLKTWAQSQGIDISYIMPMGKGPGGRGWKGQGRFGHKSPMTTPTPTQ